VFKDEISFDLSVSIIYPEKVKKKPNQTDRWKLWKIHMDYIPFSIWSQFTTEILYSIIKSNCIVEQHHLEHVSWFVLVKCFSEIIRCSKYITECEQIRFIQQN
jgi:hypothetical protein